MAAISIGGDALVGAGTGFFTAGESNVLAGGDCTGGSGLATMVQFLLSFQPQYSLPEELPKYPKIK